MPSWKELKIVQVRLNFVHKLDSCAQELNSHDVEIGNSVILSDIKYHYEEKHNILNHSFYFEKQHFELYYKV